MIAATILAAGASSRMGYPKALLRYRGRTFLQTILDSTATLGLQRLVAIGADADKILSQHDLHGVTVVVNEVLQSGPIGSVRASIRAIANDPVDGLLVWPVDLPHVAVETGRTLIDAFLQSVAVIAIPEYEGRGGHPVIFRRDVFDELLAAPDTVGARAVVRADPERVLRVAVADAAVLDRVNTPDAYRSLLRRGQMQDR